MPYRIIKKVKRAIGPRLIRSCDSTLNFGVELDDEKMCKLYRLYEAPNPRIGGIILQLLDGTGNQIYAINEEFEFDTSDPQLRGPNTKTAETGFMYIPRDLVRGYGVDDHMAIDFLLREVIRRHGGRTFSTPLYDGVLVIGPIDIMPQDERS